MANHMHIQILWSALKLLSDPSIGLPFPYILPTPFTAEQNFLSSFVKLYVNLVKLGATRNWNASW